MVFRKMPLLPKLYKFYRDHGISKTLRCLLLFYYRRLKRLLTNFAKEHVIEVNGYKLSTIPNDRGWYADELILFKTHEPLTTELLKKELKKGMVCLDIGSHIGYYSLLERKLVGGEGRVIAVEPSPLNFSYLKKNVSQNGFDDIEIFNFAFSNFDGEVNFLIASERSNICRVVEGNGPSIIKVYARSLDSFVTQYHLNRLDFLRMDVEGYEVEIINGGAMDN